MLKEKLTEVQAHLQANGLDGWLLFDFRGSNPFLRQVLGLSHAGLLTRRWWLYIPAVGKPSITVHAIERGSFPDLGWETHSYSSLLDLLFKLKNTFGNAKRIAAEYSPNGNIPYVSKLDAGTMDILKSLGLEVCSSGDLLQLFYAWSVAQLANHKLASDALTKTKNAALALMRESIAQEKPLNEYHLQQHMCGIMDSHGMHYDHAPIVCFGQTSNDPHYSPQQTGSRNLEPGAVLMDLFCKVPGDNPFADITWMAHVSAPSQEFVRVWETVRNSRDAGIQFLKQRLEGKETVRGLEVDEVVRKILIDAGLEKYLLHRTGHSLGTQDVHGDVAHFDSIETIDERQILPQLGFTIEPGAYLPEFGVRSEINVYTTDAGLEVTTAMQTELDVL